MDFKSKVNITKKYKSLKDFIQDNRNFIYEHLINGYEVLSEQEELKDFNIEIKSNIENKKFDFKYTINGSDLKLLNDILKYYEDNENYELCNKIKNIYKKLTIISMSASTSSS